MLQEFKSHIQTKFPDLMENRFLLACSGGVDSVVLAHLCHGLKMDFALAHCNFGLRGKESDGDEEFVKDVAVSIGKEFFVTHFDTIGYVNKNKVSIQMAARELRYHWFAEIMQQNGIETLVTAHQADDNLETFLINLSRGTGIDGLTGIPEKTEAIARPLLKFSKAQILNYATSKKLKWRDDSSNMETKYLRNKIRHKIVPHLKELHPSFLDNFRHTQEYLADSASILDHHIENLKEQLFLEKEDVIKINIASLLELEPLKAYLYALLKGYGFTEWDDITSLLSAMSGKEVRSKTHRLVKDRDYLLLQKLKTNKQESFEILTGQAKITAPIKLSMEKVNALDELSPKILYVDKETLNNRLTVRKWEKGDYFYPLGMKGKKKLSKFLKDEKVDVISKENQWLLCSGDNIVWVIGKRADDRFKVKPDTKEILKITLEE